MCLTSPLRLILAALITLASCEEARATAHQDAPIACLGYKGHKLRILAEPVVSAEVAGEINTGDLMYLFERRNGRFEYLAADRFTGWADLEPITAADCETLVRFSN